MEFYEGKGIPYGDNSKLQAVTFQVKKFFYMQHHGHGNGCLECQQSYSEAANNKIYQLFMYSRCIELLLQCYTSYKR